MGEMGNRRIRTTGLLAACLLFASCPTPAENITGSVDIDLTGIDLRMEPPIIGDVLRAAYDFPGAAKPSFQWMSGGKPTGDKGENYRVAIEDLGKEILVVGFQDGYVGGMISPATFPVGGKRDDPPLPEDFEVYLDSELAFVGAKLTAMVKGDIPKEELVWQWRRGTEYDNDRDYLPILGAREDTYVPVAADLGYYLMVYALHPEYSGMGYSRRAGPVSRGGMVAPQNTFVVTGGTKQFTLQPVPPPGMAFSWSIDREDLGSISDTGLLTVNSDAGEGEKIQVRATVGGTGYAPADVIVIRRVDSITISPHDLVMAPGQGREFEVESVPYGAPYTLALNPPDAGTLTYPNGAIKLTLALGLKPSAIVHLTASVTNQELIYDTATITVAQGGSFQIDGDSFFDDKGPGEIEGPTYGVLDDPVPLVIANAGSYQEILWFYEGIEVGSGASFSLGAEFHDHREGAHWVTVQVKPVGSDRTYSGTIKVTLTML